MLDIPVQPELVSETQPSNATPDQPQGPVQTVDDGQVRDESQALRGGGDSQQHGDGHPPLPRIHMGHQPVRQRAPEYDGRADRQTREDDLPRRQLVVGRQGCRGIQVGSDVMLPLIAVSLMA